MLAYIRDLRTFRKNDETGASAVEYALLIAAIAGLIILVVFAFGGIVKETFDDTCDRIARSDSATGTDSCAD